MNCSAKTQHSVSVVMSVYDKPQDVIKTVESVLSQTGVQLELVIVSDGASDEVVSVLTDIKDDRVKVHYQFNQGLTAALIKGCQLASHELIARIDAGDCMLPERLVRQANCIATNSDMALVACWVKMQTDEGFALYDVKLTQSSLMAGLTATDHRNFKSPVHACVMFRTSAYHKVGGYRSAFYFAQDCDLWARLASEYQVGVIEQVLQTAVFSASGISGRNAAKQRELAMLVCKLNELRQSDGGQKRSEAPVLAAARAIRPDAECIEDLSKGPECNVVKNSDFDGNYFIASVLSKTQPEAALIYWDKALSEKPLHPVARMKKLWCWFKSISN